MSAPEDGWTVYDRIALDDPSTLSQPLRYLLAFGGLRTEVNNGGFSQYFFNSAGDLAPDALEAAIETKCDQLADLLRRAMTNLPVPYPTDRETRWTHLDVDGGTVDAALEPLDAEYYELEATVDLDAAMNELATRAAS